MADLSTFIASAKLPIMPEVAHALIRTLNEEDADVATVRNVISKDPSLTTTLLRMANSAMFGLSRKVDNLDNAINVVGMAQIRSRALSICMANVFVLPRAINRLEFWGNSMACAGYSKWLAHAHGGDEQQAWLTGMMLRLGELIIGQKSEQVLTDVERQPRAPGERWSRETAALGFDEGQITAEVANRWDFPDEVVQALRFCARPLLAEPFSSLGATVHLGALLADHASADPQVLHKLPADVVARLQLDLTALALKLPDPQTFSDVSMLAA